MEIKKINLDADADTQPSTSEVVSSPTPKNKFTTPLFIVLAVVLGVSTGVVLKNLKSRSTGGTPGVDAPVAGSAIKVGEVFGAKDKSGFPDETTGILEEGGINGEGTHKLLRPGGVSQTVYLTSSILDMDEFVGFRVTIWGETFSAQKAGWLMDVGRVKVEELTPAPFEE